MTYCLNPKKPHENKDVPLQASPAVQGAVAGAAQVAVNEQVSCQYCKYLLEGALLGDCRVTRWIGSGAFGDVYEATQMRPMSRRVAIKVMLPERVGDEESAELFEREISAIAALDHPNILPVLRAGTLEDGRSYLVMKYAAQGSLQKHCQLTPQGLSILPTSQPVSAEIETRMLSTVEGDDGGEDDKKDMSSDTVVMANDGESGSDVPQRVPAGQTMTPQQLLRYLEDAAAALQYAHDHALIHLDVKPANLLLDGEDRLMLADFGVSTILDGYTHASLHCYVGTPVYTAPEQWLERPRPASDQYALAITCYQLLTGRPPFSGNLYSIMHGHLQLPPLPMRDLNPLIPEQVEEVILRALAKEPAERYKDVRSFAGAYREALEQAAIASTDVQGHRHESREKREASKQPALAEYPTVITSRASDDAPENKVAVEAGQVKTRVLKQTAPLSGAAFGAVQSDKLPVSPARKMLGRVVGIIVLVVLLGGGTLGAMRAFTPCLLGVCPALRLSTSEVDITNSDSQVVKITNPGSADLQWSVTNPVSAPWLVFSPQGGSLPPGRTAALTIRTNADGLSNGIDTAQLNISGQGVNTLSLVVKLTVQTGLSQIAAKASNNTFVYDQAGIHPASSMIIITNKSGQDFSWYIEYKDFNNWLQVTPTTGTLAAGGTETLQVTANGQGLPPDTYTADFSILGSLGQSDPGILTSFEFTMAVKPSAQQVTPTVTPTTTATATPTFPPITFSAQAPAASNAPATLRSGHSMVWDSQDDLFFVFGGIDGQGNLLNDLWSYSPVTGQWSQITGASMGSGTSSACPGGTWPAARMNAAMVWDSAHAQILLYGGMGAGHYFGDLWSYSPSTGAGNWEPLACSNAGPGARASNAVWNGSQMLLLGGMDRFGLRADFWAYTPGNNGSLGNWQRLTDFPGGQRDYQTMVWDSSDNQLLTFGGLDANNNQLDDFYSYTDGGGWNEITPSSASNPKARQQGIGAWDGKDHVMLMMGGWNDKDTGGPYWGLWAYDPGTNLWALLTPLNNSNNNIIPGRTASALAWDGREQAAYIYAGAGSGKSGSTLNDLWMVTSS